MKTIIEGKEHKVVYIDYHDNMPHSVVTLHFIDNAEEPYWRPVYWDFFLNENCKDDRRAYESGSGGSSDKIAAPHWADGYLGKYWMADEMSFEGIPINGKQLKNPILLSSFYYSDSTKTRNPFNAAEITFSEEYCDRCGYTSTDFCHEHKDDDDEGNVRYKDDDSYE